jgi:hypothetical protein
MVALPLGLPWGRVSAAVAIWTVPVRPAASEWPGLAIVRLCWPGTWVPAAAVMPRSSHSACSQVRTGIVTDRNFVPTLAARTDELIATSCLPAASAVVLAVSPTTTTLKPSAWSLA